MTDDDLEKLHEELTVGGMVSINKFVLLCEEAYKTGGRDLLLKAGSRWFAVLQEEAAFLLLMTLLEEVFERDLKSERENTPQSN